MNNSSVVSLSKHFEKLTDPRAEHSIDHLLIDMVIITICAVICGANNWVEIENYGHGKKQWERNVFRVTPGNSLSRYINETICSFKTKPITTMFSFLDGIGDSNHQGTSDCH